ncbi:hypothetical protein GCM10022226_15100 [Sphaerisporangium flaviroseum]|uniref:CopC domain-containing protein n=1 Tax=Sphaerisporangium flaviroseum TaxID=509199 RepID=A0ABP7HM54_9ACTN
MRRLLAVLLVACAALAVAVAPAQAHNVLTGSDPRDGSTLSSVPGKVTLTFDQPVRADFAQVALTSPDGIVSAATVEVMDNEVTATLPATVAAGAYIVGYQIVSNDGHPVSGKIGFTVTGGTGQTPATTARQIAPSDAPVPSSGGWVWGLLVVALLLSGLGILIVARKGRRKKGSRG